MFSPILATTAAGGDVVVNATTESLILTEYPATVTVEVTGLVEVNASGGDWESDFLRRKKQEELMLAQDEADLEVIGIAFKAVLTEYFKIAA